MAARTEKPTSPVVWRVLIILARLAVGLTFIVSGWSKSVDPWGFVYKIDEYLTVWNLHFPRELTLTGAVSLSVAEFTVGVLVAVGAMRRGAVWLAALFMAGMLPLTVYIAIADPVSDCGCFGDFIILSNTATLVKNIIIAFLIVILLKFNTRVGRMYAPGIQWLVVACSVAFSLSLAYFGYRYQPVVDFRPYPTGSLIYQPETEDDAEEMYIYSRGGEKQAFRLDELPDSTWTYVGMETDADLTDSRTLAVSDGDDDVTADVLGADGDMLVLAVSDPGIHYLTRARLANELAAAIRLRGGRMVALVAAGGDMLDGWRQLALPSYEVYTSEDTALKELVRGDAGLLFIRDGRIIWKRNFASVRYDALRDAEASDEFFSDSMAVDDGSLNLILSGAFVICLLLIYTLNFPNRILDRYFERRSQKKS